MKLLKNHWILFFGVSIKMASNNSNESHTEKTPITGNYPSQPPPTYVSRKMHDCYWYSTIQAYDIMMSINRGWYRSWKVVTVFFPIFSNFSSSFSIIQSAITSPSLGLGPSVGPMADSVLSQGPQYQMRLAPPEIAQYSYPYPYPNVQNPPGTVVDQPQINVELRCKRIINNRVLFYWQFKITS